ncbi:NYN domain-containing protein [Psychrobacter sp. T6-6]|uniref:NYN domain-containing protein n=1 Tax=Psychrobacter sp. T6-6 TaxID=3457452 RepID=UPI003FD3B5CC
MSAKLHNIAVLIDADNASAKNIGYILQKVEAFGRVTCKNIYGDWGNAHIKSWQEAMLKHAITPMQQFAYAKGKNATDIGLVIEAMDLLHSGHYDGFCLVSSDSDFTALALRIRKNGTKVFGFGKRSTTVDAFTQSCDEFYYVEDLVTLPKILPISENKDAPSLDIKTKPLLPVAESKTSSEKWTTKALQKQIHLINILNKLIKEDPNSAKGWSNLSYLASHIKQHHTNIKLDRYGYAKFSELITAMALYDIRTVNKVMSIKLKDDSLPTSSVAPNDNAASVCSKKSRNITNSKKIERQLPSKNKQDNNIESKIHAPLIIPPFLTSIKIQASNIIDVALFKLYMKGQAKDNDDLIFCGQTHDRSHTIELRQQSCSSILMTQIECALHKIPKEVTQLMVVLSTNAHRISIDQKNPLIHVQIQNYCRNNKGSTCDILFESDFDISQKDGKGLKLFNLTKVNDGWNFSAINQDVKYGLRQMCEQYGIEISDE